MSNFKQAWRNLAKTPFVTAVAVVSLALGIGANAAIFSLFDQILLRPLPVKEPGRLVSLSAPGPKPGSQSCNQAGDCDEVFTYAMFRDLEKAGGAFSGVAAHRYFGANLATDERTLSGGGMLVSGSYFPVLGLRPALGRLISPADDVTPGEHAVAVLSHRFWQTQFGGDPGVLGETLVVNGKSLTVIGVAPPGFEGTTLGAEPDVFVPLTMRAALESFFNEDNFEDRRVYWAYLFARLAPGVSMEQAQAQISGVYRAIINEVEAPLQEGMSEQTMERFRAKDVLLREGWRGQSSVHGETRTPLILLFAITFLVLLIACANIANLLLARGVRRTQEMAVRSSLGAGRRQLLGQLFTESALLAALGGAAGLLAARWTLVLIGRLLPPDAVATVHLELSPKVMLFTAALALLTGLLFGAYPALHAARPDLVTALKAGAGQPSGARSAALFRSGLVTAQIALSMALLLAAGLFIKSLVNVSRVDLGLEKENLITFSIAPALNGYEPERSLALFEQVEEELAAIPGVTSVSGALVPILTGNNWGSDVYVEGFERGPDTDANARFNKVGPGYFRTLGVPLLAGREFTPGDRDGVLNVAIVNESFAEKFHLGGPEAVGKWMSTDSEELDTQIVGLVQDAKYSEVKDDVPPLFFAPYRQNFQLGFLTFYVRTGIAPQQVMQAIPALIKRLDPNLPVDDLKTLDQQVRENVYLDRVITTLAAAFAVLATLLAAVGLYGVLAYTVAQRTREIGLRMALGAGSESIRHMVLGQMGRMLALGGAVGIAVALAMGRLARSLLFGLGGADPAVLALGTVVLALVALAAAYLPARRASRVDPMQALRYE